jgi:hypothetical protein
LNDLFYYVNLGQISASCVILTSVLQVYNWFSHKSICTMMALFFSSEYFGFMTPIPLLTKFDYASEPIYYFAAGVLFLAISAIESKTFAYCPLEKNILVD